MAETSTGDCGNQHPVSSFLTTEDAALAAIIYRWQYEQQEPTSRLDMTTLCVVVLASEEGATHHGSSYPRNLEQPNWLKFTQLACTVPTQPKNSILSAIKTIGYKSFITRSE
jgi:hypothetical protein